MNQYGENDPSAKQVGAGDDSMVPCEVCGQPGHWPSKHANDAKELEILRQQLTTANAEVEKHRLEIQALEDQVVDFSAEVERLKKERIERQIVDAEHYRKMRDQRDSARARTASIVDAWWNING